MWQLIPVNPNMPKTSIGMAALFTSILFIAQCGSPKPTLSRGELKNLLANAKTPADHLKLAAYYRAEADAFEADAKEHEELAAYYQDDSWQIRGRAATAHCERLVIAARDAARAALALATAHEDMAKDLARGKP